MTEHSQNIPYM